MREGKQEVYDGRALRVRGISSEWISARRTTRKLNLDLEAAEIVVVIVETSAGVKVRRRSDNRIEQMGGAQMLGSYAFDATTEQKTGLQSDESRFLLVLPAHERGIEVGAAARANCYKNILRKVRLWRISGDDQTCKDACEGVTR